jgi:glycosyltransferase involved in cell wall biosynthesis
LGRLVRRKGFRWFVEQVLPATANEVHYLVAGGGPEAGAIIEAARAAGVSDRVHLLGQVGNHLRDQLFFGCDLMVQPNIRVPNDVEGFGLVIIESTLRGTPVVAASLQGIKDAVVDRVTGLLVPTESSSDWCELIVKLTSDPSELEVLGATFRENAIDLYGQERMARELLSVIDNDRA